MKETKHLVDNIELNAEIDSEGNQTLVCYAKVDDYDFLNKLAVHGFATIEVKPCLKITCLEVRKL